MGRILICDHNCAEANRVEALLIEEGYMVDVVTWISDVLYKIGSDSYQTVILGINKDRSWGIESISLINQVKRDLPIIIIVEEDSVEFQREIRKGRIFYYFVRPVAPEEIKAVVKGAVSKSKRIGSFSFIN